MRQVRVRGEGEGEDFLPPVTIELSHFILFIRSQ